MRLVRHYTDKRQDTYLVMLRTPDGDYIMDKHHCDVHYNAYAFDREVLDILSANGIIPFTEDGRFGGVHIEYSVNRACAGLAVPRDNVQTFVVRNPVFEADVHILRDKKNTCKIHIDTVFGNQSCSISTSHMPRLIIDSILSNNSRAVDGGIVIDGTFVYNGGYSLQREA